MDGIRYEVKRHYTSANNEQKIVTNQTFDTTWNLKPTKVEITEQSSGGQLNKEYIGCSYNTWGGLESETTSLTAAQFSDSSKKAKSTTTYAYEPNYKFLSKEDGTQTSITVLIYGSGSKKAFPTTIKKYYRRNWPNKRSSRN